MSTVEFEPRGGAPIDAQEADHRIANSLAMISTLVRLEARSFSTAPTTTNVRELLDSIAARIDGVAKLHRLLAATKRPEFISAATHLHEVAEMTRATCDSAGLLTIDYEFDASLQLPHARLEILSLILHEALVNAIKYAHPAGVAGHVLVRCGRIGQAGALLTVEDDGVGLPEGFDPQTDGGIGFRIMRNLSKQIGATLKVHPTDFGLAIQIYAAA